MQVVKADDDDPSAPSEEQLRWLSTLMASFDRVRTLNRQQDEKIRLLKAADQELEAAIAGLKSKTTKLEAETERQAKKWKQHRLDIHAGEHASHGLQEGGGLHRSTPSSHAILLTLALYGACRQG